jgi:uncharacterized protein YdhG (YjbR/CyaY superfamily)
MVHLTNELFYTFAEDTMVHLANVLFHASVQSHCILLQPKEQFIKNFETCK